MVVDSDVVLVAAMEVLLQQMMRSRNLRGTKSRLITENLMRSRRTAETIFGVENKSVGTSNWNTTHGTADHV
eukprot:scaffold358508_cov20-Attheya_sp.AAC.1